MAAPGVDLLIVEGRPTVRGECDMANASEIENWLASFDDAPLQVDLSGVTFFDWSALRTFLHVLRCNPDVRVVNPSAAVLRVLEMTGTVEYLVDGRSIFGD